MIPRRPLAVLAAAALSVVSLIGAPSALASGDCTTYAWSGGDGSSASPYLVASQADLEQISACLDKSFRQTADIALTGEWTPIGALFAPFTGRYDGNDQHITGLLTSDGTATRVGLFGLTSGGAVVQQTHVQGTVAGAEYVGGLIGQAESTTVTDSSTDVTILAGAPGWTGVRAVGGLIGYAVETTVSGSSATGMVRHAPSAEPVGSEFGGLIGSMADSRVILSSALGDVSGEGSVGGLIGLAGGGVVSQSYATGAVHGGYYVGGLIGFATQDAPSDEIIDVYATGHVSARDNTGGGLIGIFSGTAGSGNPARGYATGRVSSPTVAGGFIGWVSAGTKWLSGFWDAQASGQAQGASDGPISGVTGLDTAAMKSAATYSDAAWSMGPWASSGTIWGICPAVNDGYPYLQAFHASDPCGASAGQPLPPPWQQAYSRSADGTCLTGWNPSWAQWPNDGAGGFVCQRTLVYNPSITAWEARRLLV